MLAQKKSRMRRSAWFRQQLLVSQHHDAEQPLILSAENTANLQHSTEETSTSKMFPVMACKGSPTAYLK